MLTKSYVTGQSQPSCVWHSNSPRSACHKSWRRGSDISPKENQMRKAPNRCHNCYAVGSINIELDAIGQKRGRSSPSGCQAPHPFRLSAERSVQKQKKTSCCKLEYRHTYTPSHLKENRQVPLRWSPDCHCVGCRRCYEVAKATTVGGV
jgi:hypothetical protein